MRWGDRVLDAQWWWQSTSSTTEVLVFCKINVTRKVKINRNRKKYLPPYVVHITWRSWPPKPQFNLQI